jgi:hypothetical protein
MYGTQIRYRAERVDTEADGMRVRIITELEGVHADLRDHRPRHIETMREDQARKLRDDLNEVLGDG